MLTSRISRQLFKVVASRGHAGADRPALLITMSSAPKRSTVPATRRATASSCDTSHCMNANSDLFRRAVPQGHSQFEGLSHRRSPPHPPRRKVRRLPRLFRGCHPLQAPSRHPIALPTCCSLKIIRIGVLASQLQKQTILGSLQPAPATSILALSKAASKSFPAGMNACLVGSTRCWHSSGHWSTSNAPTLRARELRVYEAATSASRAPTVSPNAVWLVTHRSLAADRQQPSAIGKML